ncbi:MAG: asparagine synthase (glutamine-hydrolyzing) [Phycisphaerales bacterium]|nr:asparagine synthase (glutamine-hydrolyzing) [Phycisphaerales bacterium]
MCGIAGQFGRDRLGVEHIEACRAALRHRGPDAEGRWSHDLPNGRRVDLLHRRLSIIDLDDRANQPLDDGRHVIVFNGELYNYRELRRDLEASGARFRTTSDTEVLLAALATWGEDALDRFEGMWAFAWFDRETGMLRLCRDRFGEKPLYLLRMPGGLRFASEVGALRRMQDEPLTIDMTHAYRYLVNGYKSLYKDRRTSFHRDVTELPPATIMRVDAEGRTTIARYWTPSPVADETMTRADAVEAIRAALVRTVDLRLRADVPPAFLLSGGVDSNTLVSIATRVLGRDVHAFTIVNTDDRYDERPIVARTVRELGVRHTEIPLEKTGFLDHLRTLVRGHGAPVFTITYFAQWRLLARVAAAGYRVSISGTGADELFTGYFDHHNAYLYEMHEADPVAFAPALDAWRRHIEPIVRNPFLRDPHVFINDPDQRGHIFLDAGEFARFLTVHWHEPFTETTYCRGLLRNRMLNELFHEAVPPILHEDDLNAMSVSMENRSPFLDRGLFDLCQRIPTRHLIADGFAKSILRDAMRGIVPDCVLDERRKVGFNAPIGDLLDARDPEVRAAVLDRSPIYDHVRRDMIEALLDVDAMPNSRSKFLFSFLSTKMFLEECCA